MRITIFGATGMLGKALMRQSTGDQLTGLGSADADIRSPEQINRALDETHPDWIVLSAAYTDVDGCETNRELATAVNTRGAVNVAEAARQVGAKLLFISTDYVFNGKKAAPYEADDSRDPINVYGKTKADAESGILKVLPDACIVRTSWVFGPWGKCFPDTILKLAANRAELDVVDDQRGCPTYTFDLAEAIIKLCHAGAKGTVHCTNSGVCSWYEFASEVVRQSGAKTVVRPTTSDKFVRPAPRPSHSVLSDASLHKYGIRMRAWQETLRDYLQLRNTAYSRVET
ncbi:MAG TPA: dTDP-4-dehydrorhamnose reductase [Terriglobales bacterium]|nr:dTDP-4-dehydrorhamnose reductase [Terriglobales bacterium]